MIYYDDALNLIILRNKSTVVLLLFVWWSQKWGLCKCKRYLRFRQQLVSVHIFFVDNLYDNYYLRLIFFHGYRNLARGHRRLGVPNPPPLIPNYATGVSASLSVSVAGVNNSTRYVIIAFILARGSCSKGIDIQTGTDTATTTFASNAR